MKGSEYKLKARRWTNYVWDSATKLGHFTDETASPPVTWTVHQPIAGYIPQDADYWKSLVLWIEKEIYNKGVSE